MFEKIKINDRFNRLGTELGMAVMTFATVVGMLELPNHTVNRIALPNQTVTVTSNSLNNLNEINNPIRRDKEEAAPQYISYSESQRTPGRSGKY